MVNDVSATIGERIQKLRKTLGLTLEQFGARVGVKKSAISRIENGTNNATEQMKASICREFNVNKDWLLYGNGDMFLSMSKKEQVAYIVGKTLNNDDEFIQNVFITLGNLSPDEWEVAKKIIYGFLGK